MNPVHAIQSVIWVATLMCGAHGEVSSDRLDADKLNTLERRTSPFPE